MAQEKVVFNDLPELIKVHIHGKYSKYRVASIHVDDANEMINFRVELEKGSRTVSLVLSEDATVVSKIKGRMFTYDGSKPLKSEGQLRQKGDGHKH